MKIMALDPATVCGWSVYDITSTVSAIQCGSVKFEGDDAFEKVRSIRHVIPPLIKKHQPDFIIFESPLAFIPQFEKKGKSDLLGDEGGGSAPNARTILQLNRISGAVQAIIEGFRICCEEVGPRTWQTVIPKNVKGSPKDRARQYCDMLQIIGKNNDARDAALIALWASNHSQKFKMLKIERERNAA